VSDMVVVSELFYIPFRGTNWN